MDSCMSFSDVPSSEVHKREIAFFFESKNQQLLRNKISSYFSAKSSTTKSAMVTSASALSTYKEKEEDRQITLVI